MKKFVKDQSKRYKVGDIVYPYYNGTTRWFKKPRWDVITQVSPDGTISEVHYLYNYEAARAIEIMQILNKGKKDGK